MDVTHPAQSDALRLTVVRLLSRDVAVKIVLVRTARDNKIRP